MEGLKLKLFRVDYGQVTCFLLSSWASSRADRCKVAPLSYRLPCSWRGSTRYPFGELTAEVILAALLVVGQPSKCVHCSIPGRG